MTAGRDGSGTGEPIAVWIDLHRLGERPVVRCRAHVLGVGDTGADVDIDEDIFGRDLAGAAVTSTGETLTELGLALGRVLVPAPVKDLLATALRSDRPVELRLRAHDGLDGVPWELARFRLGYGPENLSLNTAPRPPGPWTALLRQVDVHTTAREHRHVTGIAALVLGPSTGVPRDVSIVLDAANKEDLPAVMRSLATQRSVDEALPEGGAPATAVRASLVYLAGHLGGLRGDRRIQLDDAGLGFDSLRRRLETAQARVAVLNICETADRDGDERSWIERLCASGTVDAAIGLKGRIDGFDESHLVAGPLIGVLAAGGSVAEAVHRVRESFRRPGMVVAATGAHGPVTVHSTERPAIVARARGRAQADAPIAVVVATGADGSFVATTGEHVSVEVAGVPTGPVATDWWHEIATRAAAEAAHHLGVDPPAWIRVAVPPGERWLRDAWVPSVEVGSAKAVADLGGRLLPDAAVAELIDAVASRGRAERAAVSQLFDDRRFPTFHRLDGSVVPAPTPRELELVVLDYEVTFRSGAGRPALEPALASIGDDAAKLLDCLHDATDAWMRTLDRRAFGFALNWYRRAGLLTLTTTPGRRLAGVVAKGGAAAAIRALRGLNEGPRSLHSATLSIRGS